VVHRGLRASSFAGRYVGERVLRGFSHVAGS
jgi:hypothetical protein